MSEMFSEALSDATQAQVLSLGWPKSLFTYKRLVLPNSKWKLKVKLLEHDYWGFLE